MDLTFVQTSNMFGRDGAWETEFSVDQEFNLHLERESSGKIIMMQKTAGTFFDIVKDFDMKSGDVVYDYDSASFLGTKTIKIVSESAIRFASLTTSGEVTEIKSQSKEIEVTSNGTTEVTPDAGFSYLNSVKVKTNVPQSGEGGGSASAMEYYDVSAEEFSLYRELAVVGSVVKVREDGGVIIAPPMMALISSQSIDTEKLMNVVAFGANPTTKIVGGVFGDAGIELSEAMGGDEFWNKMPRITEEEFYNLNA